MIAGDDILIPLFIRKDLVMDKNIETMLIECHILMSDALKGYEDRAYISNKLFEIRQYRNKLPEDVYGKIKKFADKNIRPMAYDAISGLS